MAVTRSNAAERARRGPVFETRRTAYRSRELVLLILGSIVIGCGIYLAARGRLDRVTAATGPAPLDLTLVERAEQLLPSLDVIQSPVERQYVARKILDTLRDRPGEIANVGTLARIRVPLRQVLSTRGLAELQERARAQLGADRDASSLTLLSPAQFSHMKPAFTVRSAGRFRQSLLWWSVLFFAGFYAVHGWLTFRRFGISAYILPSLLLLSGMGLILMISLRDPLRDTLAFADFAQGTALGCVALAAAALPDYNALTGRLSYIPLLGSFLLSAALIAFGTGPGSSDAKVNLLGFQPAELIRLLIVFFLAGYFADRWELLRTLRDRRPQLSRISRWVEVPRLEYVLPVLAGVAVTLAFFFLQKDLGPALLIACLFLAMYAIARDRYLFATAGLSLILGGFLAGYLIGYPRTVSSRVSMWLSPWDNSVRGGEQVVHALWAMATGGATGTGIGLGDPELMPAAHTDLILAALGEEWGFIGVAVLFALYAVLVLFGLRTARRASSDYSFFLALGLTLALSLQIALIAGGVLDLVPLSGVVLPFLSYGRTALITNFAIVGMLIAVARTTGAESTTQPFREGTRAIGLLLAGACLFIVGKAAWVQIVRGDATVGAGALTMQADGVRRYQYNPRLLAIARSIPRGAIYDRNGLPLASSNWDEIAGHKEAYGRAGISLPDQPGRDTRYYPLGARAVHLLGDIRTRANWGARNSSLAERDYTVALQGYDDRATVVQVKEPKTGKTYYTVRYDFRELLPLLRHRYEPDNPAVKRVRDRDRNLHLSIDARLQMRASAILERQLKKLGREKGAVVVLDASSGDLLASVSYPWPLQDPPTLSAPDSDDTMLDRARYGLYPPGSSFKLVTAMAALRKEPSSVNQTYECRRLPDGRVGNYIKGWSRPIRDDVADKSPHGVISMRQGLIVSCNAYFAQLGTLKLGPQPLLETANLLGISVATPATEKNLRGEMPQASYGQGQVVASPFQMARVAATVAAHGSMPYGRWVIDQNNNRLQPPQAILNPQLASELGEFMRGVVTSGTGRSAGAATVSIAGKTGTAELERAPSHAWFIGYAPYEGQRPVAFAVLIENGRYGGSAAAPVAAEVVNAAKELGLFERPE